MSIENALGLGTLVLLVTAAVTLLNFTVSQLKAGRKIKNDFTLLMSLLILGWLSTEILAVLRIGSTKQPVDAAHFAVLLTFAIMLTLRWKRAVAEAFAPPRGADR